MPTTFEFNVWAEGQAFDAEGHPLDHDGNVIAQPESSQDDTATQEDPK